MVSMAAKPFIDSKIRPEYIYDTFLMQMSIRLQLAGDERDIDLDSITASVLKTAAQFQKAEKKSLIGELERLREDISKLSRESDLLVYEWCAQKLGDSPKVTVSGSGKTDDPDTLEIDVIIRAISAASDQPDRDRIRYEVKIRAPDKRLRDIFIWYELDAKLHLQWIMEN